jgi:hypothetical protein
MIRPSIEIIRLEESPQGTFGVLKIAKEVFCFTLEPKDLLNAPDLSSIPAQQYVCVRWQSLKFGETFMVTDVPERSSILFHVGNVDDETEGCILLGSTIGKLKGDRAILNSGNTFKEFMDRLEGYNEFHLTIKEEY